jgi:protein-S-isoprenylcysteine O-methyltransferase Ste14
VFFRGFFRDAAPGRELLPLGFSWLFALWVAVEYYFGSPFFQSGISRPSSIWRIAFALFVYPFLGYVVADFVWFQRPHAPVVAVLAAVMGLVAFCVGTWIRLEMLVALLRAARQRSGGNAVRAKAAEFGQVPFRRLIGLRFQRLCRQPRYLGTLMQLLGAALFFRSWIGLVALAAIGFPLIVLQARSEDLRLSAGLGDEWTDYRESVPLLVPRPR